jgi:hypothetical protein
MLLSCTRTLKRCYRHSLYMLCISVNVHPRSDHSMIDPLLSIFVPSLSLSRAQLPSQALFLALHQFQSFSQTHLQYLMPLLWIYHPYFPTSEGSITTPRDRDKIETDYGKTN